MTTRVQTQGDLVFGIMADAEVTATHARFRRTAAPQNPVVKQLNNPVTAAVTERLRVPSGDLDVVYPEGETSDGHMTAVVTPYWDGVEFQVDLMTSANNVVGDSGYSQQTYDNWAISTE